MDAKGPARSVRLEQYRLALESWDLVLRAPTTPQISRVAEELRRHLIELEVTLAGCLETGGVLSVSEAIRLHERVRGVETYWQSVAEVFEPSDFPNPLIGRRAVLSTGRYLEATRRSLDAKSPVKSLSRQSVPSPVAAPATPKLPTAPTPRGTWVIAGDTRPARPNAKQRARASAVAPRRPAPPTPEKAAPPKPRGPSLWKRLKRSRARWWDSVKRGGRAVGRALTTGIDRVAFWGLKIAVGLASALQGFGVFSKEPLEPRVRQIAFGFTIGYIIDVFWSLNRSGSLNRRYRDRMAAVTGQFGGAIETLDQMVIQRGDRSVDETSCKYICTLLLARIAGYIEAALDVPHGVNIRVSLAVPQPHGSDPPRSLRVWCYDKSHANRQFSTLPIDWPGGPAAFQSGQFQIIEDLQDLDDVPEMKGRDYRSVLCIPVRAGPNGKRLAVVSIDSSERNYFDREEVIQKVIPFVQPVVSVIALVLLLRREGIRYEFES